ncbi:MAG: DUF371 domain-containing protein [Candidatus Bathyarchaeota archaeon]|nr:DUF371 domain-containing protein [Candidatus Bathyarchaeota archaeon]
MLLEESFAARGHANIRATHEKTVEVTRETRLTTQGDCIVAVVAEKGLRDLDPRMREAARRPDSVISLSLRLGDRVFTTTGRGDPGLTWDHPTDMVARISGYTCARTLMVHADKATIHIPRTLVQLLKDPKAVVTVTVTVEVPD